MSPFYWLAPLAVSFAFAVPIAAVVWRMVERHLPPDPPYEQFEQQQQALRRATGGRR